MRVAAALPQEEGTLAKPVGVELEARLAEMRTRGLLGVSDGGGYDAMLRLHEVRRALTKLGDDSDAELYRHFPVAAIAVLEAYFRWFVVAVVDSGEPYLARGLSLAKDRLRASADMLAVIHRKTVSLGELVAFGLPLNSVSTLDEPISLLLDAKPKQLFARAILPHFTRWDAAGMEASTVRTPIVQDVDAMYRDLAMAFEQRHIFAHEAAPTYPMTYAFAKASVDCVDQVCHAMESVLWDTAWRNKPLTQPEINRAACSRAGLERARLAAALRHGLKIAAAKGERNRFRALHATWKQYGREWMRWQAEPFVMGAFRPFYAALDQEELCSARAGAVESWIHRVRSDSHANTSR